MVNAAPSPAMTVDDRHRRALQLIADAAPGGPVPPAAPSRRVDEFPLRIARDDLTAASLEQGIADVGCVLLPNLLTTDTAAELRDAIDRAFAGYDRYEGGSGTDDPWFDAYIPAPSTVHSARPWLRGGGGLFTPDSPILAARWFGLLRSTGITALVAAVFGEEPITSLDKCSLRKVRAGEGIEWHQDGSFLGVDSGALNLWVSLSDTDDAPGLDMLPRRFTEIVETGSGGAGYGWSTGPEVVAELASGTGIARPRFAAGDALLFDGLLLHRTAQPPPDFSGVRYAIETWFFRPSWFPDHQQVPIAL